MTEEKPTIVLVDDDPDVIEQISLILTGEGCQVRSADNASDAEETLLSVRPDLAILDVMMEERDSGFVLCHLLKKLYPQSPVIILTAVKAATGISFVATTAEEKSWVQADCILDKPVQPDRLRAEVRRLLGRPASPPSAHRRCPSSDAEAKARMRGEGRGDAGRDNFTKPIRAFLLNGWTSMRRM